MFKVNNGKLLMIKGKMFNQYTEKNVQTVQSNIEKCDSY